MVGIFLLLMAIAYLLGSLPMAYLVAKYLRGIDLRQCGTGQVGAGNLWRMTSSWKLGLAAGIFDFSKGLIMVIIAHLTGLGIPQQFAIGIAAIAGHNWPVFLKFTGGRGVGTALGVILILPIVNTLNLWVITSFAAFALVGSVALRSSPAPVLAGLISMPVVSACLGEPIPVTLGYLALTMVIIIKRLAVPLPANHSISLPQLMMNRLLFDRDIKDRKRWMYRRPGPQAPKDACR